MSNLKSAKSICVLAAAVVIAALFCTGVSAQTVLVQETFDNGLPAGWTQFTGSSSVQGGTLALSYGCLVLPEEFHRSAGLKLDADVDITWGYAGDFNFFVFFDPFNPQAPHCYYPTGSGYNFAYYPVGSDNYQDTIGSFFPGGGTTLASAPTVMQANHWHHVTAELLPDGTLRESVDGNLRLQAVNQDHQDGPIVLRSWGTVYIDNLQITSLCTFGPANGPFVLSRDRGKPVWDSRSWSSCGGSGVLQVSTDHVASAFVYLNGELILTPSDFNAHQSQVEVPVELVAGENDLEVQLRGAPGSEATFAFVESP